MKAIVDSCQYEEISKHKWCFLNGYAVRNKHIKGVKSPKMIYMHRQIAETPDGMETDHINGNKLDNRKSNLRICLHSQNGKNLKLSKANKTGFKGVDLHSQNKNFRAQIMCDGKLVHLGCFKTAEEAGAAYSAASKRLHGEYSNK